MKTTELLVMELQEAMDNVGQSLCIRPIGEFDLKNQLKDLVDKSNMLYIRLRKEEEGAKRQ